MVLQETEVMRESETSIRHVPRVLITRSLFTSENPARRSLLSGLDGARSGEMNVSEQFELKQ